MCNLPIKCAKQALAWFIVQSRAEITATSPSLRIVKIANDPKAKKFTEKSINQFGTRHRSALRLCSSFEKSMCLVISQDGNVRAIKRVGPELYMWNDINLNRFGF